MKKAVAFGLAFILLVVIVLENAREAEGKRGPPSYIRRRVKCIRGEKKGLDGICRPLEEYLRRKNRNRYEVIG